MNGCSDMKQRNLDALDRKLLNLLQRDSRSPIASLSAATGVSRATVKARIDRLVETNIIENFTIKTGAEFRDSTVTALVQVEVQGQAADRVGNELLRLSQVRTIYSTNGRWDLIAKVEVSDLRAFDESLRCIRLINGITLTESNLLLSTRHSSS